MKKFITILIVLMLLLTGCFGEDTPETTGTGDQTVPTGTFSEEGPEGVLEEKDTVTVYRLARSVSYDQDGAETMRREYSYDGKGYLTEQRDYYGTSFASFVSKYTNDDSGRPVKAEFYDGNGELVNTQEYSYDENGNLLLQQTYENGKVSDYSEYTYNDQGDQITYRMYFGGQLEYDWTYAYSYDDNGNILVCDEMMGGELVYRVENTWDEEGRCVETVTRNAAGGVDNRVKSTWEGSTETKTYYDMDGNVILTTVTTYDSEGNTTFEEMQYMGGHSTMTEYTYEPLEITK